MRKHRRKSRRTVSNSTAEKSASHSHGETPPTKPGEKLHAAKRPEPLIERVRRHTITDPSLQRLERLIRELQIRNASPYSFLGLLRDIKRRGRHRDIAKWTIWTEGARLRTENQRNWSWHKLTRKLDPEGYAADAQRATDRMRQGIETVLGKLAKSH